MDVFSCVKWQVTLCDPIWQVRLRSCEIPRRAIHITGINKQTGSEHFKIAIIITAIIIIVIILLINGMILRLQKKVLLCVTPRTVGHLNTSSIWTLLSSKSQNVLKDRN